LYWFFFEKIRDCVCILVDVYDLRKVCCCWCCCKMM